MFRRLVIVALAGCTVGVTLTGFAEPSPTPQASERAKAGFEEYEKYYRAAFRENGVQKCIASAPKAAAAGFDVTPTCECASDVLLATKSVEELTKMASENKATDELAAITVECMKSNPPVKRPKAG